MSVNSHAEVEFRHLHYFVAVAEELHFGRAAARLFITQPALSQAIAGMERSLRVNLFIRTRQNVELTAAGTELLRHARRMLADREVAVASVQRIERGEAGVLPVGVALLAEHEVAPALAALVAELGGLFLDRSVATSGRLLASLEARALDAAIVYRVPGLATLGGIDTEVIRRGRLAVLVSQASALANLQSVRFSDLREERFLAPPCELTSSSLGGIKAICRAYGGFEPELLELTTSSMPLGGVDWEPIVNGDAIATMPEGTARAVRPEGTAVVAIQPPAKFSLAVAWRRDDASPILQRFLAFIRQYRDEHAWTQDRQPP